MLAVTRLLTGCIALGYLLALTTPALATPAQDFDEARTAFRQGKYPKAISLLSSLLYPNARLARSEQLAEAHLLLGVSYFETGKNDSAAREFEEALFIDTAMSLGGGIFSVEVVTFFKEKKEELERRTQDDEEKAKLAKERDRLRKALENMVVIEKRDYFVNFIPLGAGQFQNGQRVKGSFFFVGQAILGGTSLTAYLVQILRYGFPNGTVPPEDVDFVNRLQIVQITTGALFFGAVAWGIIDSLVYYKPKIQRLPDPSLLKDIKDILKQSESTLELVPMVGPNTAGASLRLEF